MAGGLASLRFAIMEEMEGKVIDTYIGQDLMGFGAERSGVDLGD